MFEESLIKKIREKFNNFMLDTNSINRIMTDKVNDYIILEEQPLAIPIGNKTIYVGNFTFDNDFKFMHKWGKIISFLSARIINMELSIERKKELLEKADFNMLANGKYMLEFLYREKWFKNQFCKLLKNTLLKQQGYFLNSNKVRKLKKWKNCSYGYFKKNVTKEVLVQIAFLIYLYNFDAEKKNIKMLVEKMDMQQLMETYIPFWLQNLHGINGKFQVVRLGNIDSYFDDYSSSVSEEKQSEKNN